MRWAVYRLVAGAFFFFFRFRVGLDGRAQQPQYQAVLFPPSATDWIDRDRGGGCYMLPPLLPLS